MKPAPSIRAVLLGGTAALLVVVLGAAAWLGFDAGEDEAAELFDARLATSARVLAALVGPQAEAARAKAPIVVAFPEPLKRAAHDEASALGHPYESNIAFQVRDAQGALVMRSASAPTAAYAALEEGFSVLREGGQAWRVFTLRTGELWIHAAERDSVRAEIAQKLALATVAPIIAGIVLLLGLVALLTRYGLAPLAELAGRLAGRPAGTLTPVALSRTPLEIAPVVDALNALLHRERRFTADAAHELRTPLAALKVHAQNAARATTEAERLASLERLQAAIARGTRLAEQMLAYSSASADAPRPADTVSLRQVIEDALDDALPGFKARGQKIAVSSDPPVDDIFVRGDHDKLVSLARNLLDNAMRYAPAGSSVRVALRQGGGSTELAVSDEGPGIAPELRERVFESYFRIPGSPGEGSGLGLAIVREIAAQHGARVALGPGEGGAGTRVTVTFH